MNPIENSTIATLLHPLSANEFFTTHWEKAPLHVERSDSKHFSKILQMETIDSLFATAELYFPDVQLIRQPNGIHQSSYTGEHNRILPLRMLEHHRLGATITVSQADRKIGSLGNFCRELQTALQMRCQANVYLSPPGQQGFNPHYDTHDVFILQISGSKTFNFYATNVELPFTEEEFDADSFDAGQPTEEITLTAGDTLYIPRGVAHDAVALDETPSLHVTLGVYPVIVRDLLQELIQLAAEQDVRYRQCIPLTQTEPLLSRPANGQDLPTLLQTLLGNIATQENVATALDRFRDQIALQTPQDSNGALLRQQQSIPLANHCRVTINPNRVMSISHHNDVTVIRCAGQILEFNAHLGRAVQWLLARQSAMIGDIPELDQEQKEALVHRLYYENIVDLE